ncbi:branched-chain amino acid ABC transporter permease [Pusillimonas sp. TS35]|uniref:branched-chain amino acid ABC transporter permease n=1 Tax=Paracandidimonas lactea TaxID=2895524 RepID=UPI00136D2198|nr:branched-chain amino acid ABC transporter permease [Paracandidimonas lactea]MYN13883.1 branched-chain amino acid ABC transporter permease [Pusillimonas sp. TS35]
MLDYFIAISIITLIYLLLASGLNLQYGFTGLINFGHVGFFAIGAYTSALLSLQGVPLIICLVCAATAAALCAYPIGLVALRLRDDYLAIVTLGFSESLRMLLQEESWLTRGVHGIPGIPRLFANTAANESADFWIMMALFAVNALALFMIYRIVTSPFGRIIASIRDNEIAVRALGKNPSSYKLRSLMLGAGLAGIAGFFYAHYLTFIVPEQFLPLVTFYVWIVVIMGGAGRLGGMVVGTVLLMVFLEGSRFIRDFLPGIAEYQMASARLWIIGIALIFFMIYRPHGMFGDFTQRKAKS